MSVLLHHRDLAEIRAVGHPQVQSCRISSLDREGARAISRLCWLRRGRAFRWKMEVSLHRKWVLSPSFFLVGRIVCRGNRQRTQLFSAPPHTTPTLQHQKCGNDSRDIHPSPTASPIADEENLPSINHEDLVKLGIEPRLVPSFISSILRVERSDDYASQLTPVEEEIIIELLDKVTSPHESLLRTC